MKFITGFIELIDVLFASNKKSHIGKKAGGAVAKKSFKKLKRRFI